jgi:hypothetical protein
MKIRQKWRARLLAGLAIAALLIGLLSWHEVSEIRQEREALARVLAARYVKVTNVRDGRAIVITNSDKRFKRIIDVTAESIQQGSHFSEGLPMLCRVEFGNDDGSLVAADTGKHIVIDGRYYMSRFAFWELFQK